MTKTVKDLRAATGMGERQVYAGIRTGELPGYYVGKRVVIPEEAFEDFLHGRWVPNPRPYFRQPVAVTPKPLDLIKTRKSA